MVKKRIITITIIILLLLIIPVAVISYAFATPPRFSESYYGELNCMYDRLKNEKRKKIVIIGTSNVAFGIDSNLFEEELSRCGLDYSVCNFGLYGALGTKLMFDLARDYIGKDDIVIYSPEPAAQIFSLYFSPTDTWRALDSNIKMFGDVASENKPSLIGSFASYAAEKYTYSDGILYEGIYSKASFDKNCTMTASRPHNVLSGGYDANNPVKFSTDIFGKGYLEYVNKFYSDIAEKGAEMFYSFCPVNKASLEGGYDKSAVDAFCATLIERLDFPFLGNPHDYILESGWFYDTNFHLNTSGAVLRTSILADDIKAQLGISGKSGIDVPDMPELPEPTVPDGSGDNSFASYFEYAEENGTLILTALKEEGKALKEVVIPASYEGKPVTAFSADVFAGNTVIEKITINTNITRLYDKCFDGCVSLKTVMIAHTDPTSLNVGYNLLGGADNCKLYISSQSRTDFITNYLWSRYKNNFVFI